jgi:hypothetical protein
LQVYVVPRQNAVETVEQMLWFVEAVRFAGVDNPLRFDAVAFPAAIKLFTLAERIYGVSIAL